MYNSMESGDVQPAVENNKMVKPMFQGETFASKIVDAFVVMHFIFAFIFASLACFYPSIFSLFAKSLLKLECFYNYFFVNHYITV